MAIKSSAVARLSLDFIVAPPIQVSRSSPEPSAPTRSRTTDSIRAKLIPGDSDDFRRSYYRAYVRLESLASDIRESVPKYLERLQTDKSACNRFRKCMERFFPRACRDNDPDEA